MRREERDRRDDGRRDHEEHRQAVDEHLHAHVVQFDRPQRAPARAPERLPAVVLGHADASEHLAHFSHPFVRHRHPPLADRDHPPPKHLATGSTATRHTMPAATAAPSPPTKKLTTPTQ